MELTTGDTLNIIYVKFLFILPIGKRDSCSQIVPGDFSMILLCLFCELQTAVIFSMGLYF